MWCTGKTEITYTEEENPDELRRLWYQRIYRWCGKQKISIRKFNKKQRSVDVEKRIDARILGSLQAIEQSVGLNRINLEQVWNLDETALNPMFT